MTKAEMEKLVSTLSERVERLERDVEAMKAPKESNTTQPPTRSLVFR